MVLEPRLAGPGHPARPTLLLRTPRDPQNILLVQKELDRDLSFSVVLRITNEGLGTETSMGFYSKLKLHVWIRKD